MCRLQLLHSRDYRGGPQRGAPVRVCGTSVQPVAVGTQQVCRQVTDGLGPDRDVAQFLGDEWRATIEQQRTLHHCQMPCVARLFDRQRPSDLRGLEQLNVRVDQFRRARSAPVEWIAPTQG